MEWDWEKIADKLAQAAAPVAIVTVSTAVCAKLAYDTLAYWGLFGPSRQNKQIAKKQSRVVQTRGSRL